MIGRISFSLYLLSFLLFFSCEDGVMLNLEDVLKSSEGTYLHSLEMGIKQQKMTRDDSQDLILILSKERLPLYLEVLPSFSVSPNAKVWPMDNRYFESFQAANPTLKINQESFIFPEISGDKLIETLGYAINIGKKINFPPLTKTVVSAYAERYLFNGAYNYIVMSESGQLRNWRIKILDPDKEKAILVEASFPNYLNPKLDRNIYATIDQDQNIVSWVLPYEAPLRSLVPYLVANSERPILLDGKTYSSGSTVDFSAVKILRVTSPTGAVTRDYEVHITQAPSDNALFAFTVPVIGNPSLDRNITLAFINDTDLEARVPYATNLSDLKGWASISPGARSSVRGREFVDGESAQDFSSGTVVLTVHNSDNSRSRDYNLRIKEDRSGAELLRVSMGNNPGLKKEGGIYLRRKRVEIFIYQDWDFAVDGPLAFNYVISVGATATLDGKPLSNGRLVMTGDSGKIYVTSNDGVVTNIYQVTLTTIGSNTEARMLTFDVYQQDNPELFRSFYTTPEVGSKGSGTLSGKLFALSVSSQKADIQFTPGAWAYWEDNGERYDRTQVVDYSRPRILNVVSPDDSTEYPYTITLSAYLPNPIHVKIQPDKVDGDGSSWDESILLHDALDWVRLFSKYVPQTFDIWLEEGTYVPPPGTVPYTYTYPGGQTSPTTLMRYYRIPPPGGYVRWVCRH